MRTRLVTTKVLIDSMYAEGLNPACARAGVLDYGCWRSKESSMQRIIQNFAQNFAQNVTPKTMQPGTRAVSGLSKASWFAATVLEIAQAGSILAVAAIAGMLLLASAGSAAASLHLTIGNPGLDHFDSDAGVELDFGLTDQDGQPVGNLQVNNVEVYENGQKAKILDFRGVGQ
ncbi:MAG: hypothetical protein ABSG46_06045, partial [Candidatus Binataceae bacterium]